jgi:aerobic C4-dicarboxylate transport protein
MQCQRQFALILGDGFIRLIKMLIAPIIFCTVVLGIAGMDNLRHVGRVGLYALGYFEIVTTLALIIGLVVVNLVQPGAGMHVDPAELDASRVVGYAGEAQKQGITDFLLNVIPTSMFGAFAQGEILQVLLIAVLCGFALQACGARVAALRGRAVPTTAIVAQTLSSDWLVEIEVLAAA